MYSLTNIRGHALIPLPPKYRYDIAIVPPGIGFFMLAEAGVFFILGF